MSPKPMKLAPSDSLVDAVRAFVESIARDETVSEGVACVLVSLALARVAGEVAANTMMRELFDRS